MELTIRNNRSRITKESSNFLPFPIETKWRNKILLRYPSHPLPLTHSRFIIRLCVVTRKHSQRGSLLLLSYFPLYPVCKIAKEEVERLLACGPGWLESRFRRDSREGEREREKVTSQRASQGARTLKLLFVGFQRDLLLSVQRSSIMRFASSAISFMRAHHFSRFFPSRYMSTRNS